MVDILKTFSMHFLNDNDFSDAYMRQCTGCTLVYRQTFNISRTKSQNLKLFRLVLQLSSPNHLKPRVKSRMEM